MASFNGRDRPYVGHAGAAYGGYAQRDFEAPCQDTWTDRCEHRIKRLFKMIDDQHWGFILAAYALSICVFGGLLSWIVADYRLQNKALAGLEAAGAKRRSDGDLE